MISETASQRSERIISLLRAKHPDKKCFDLDGNGTHFVCEVEPTADHPAFDVALEVIISSKLHKHLKMKQQYTVISGTLELHIEDKVFRLTPGDQHVVEPGTVHWALSDDECWVEIFSEPGWTAEDHIAVLM